MTNEEAIKFLKTWNPIHPLKQEAKGIAIEALEKTEQMIGYWIDDCSCSVCSWINDGDDGFARIATHFNYCPNCGAKMS